jgi:uncharacterized protein
MWGKHDEIRELLKGSIEILNVPDVSKDDLIASAELVLIPAANRGDRHDGEGRGNPFPMSMDALGDADWYQIRKQSVEIGFCLYDPPTEWVPEGMEEAGNQ